MSVHKVENKVEERFIFDKNNQLSDSSEVRRAIDFYSDRWLIKNGFHSVKKFLAQVHSASRKS